MSVGKRIYLQRELPAPELVEDVYKRQPGWLLFSFCRSC